MKKFKSISIVFCFLLSNFVSADWTSFQLTDNSYAECMSSIALDSYGNPNFAWCSNDDGNYDIYNNPENINLSNYPNPFNSSTTISFSVESSDKNTGITIYNYNGQKIKTLVDKKLEAGTHQVVWDAANDLGNPVPAGVYFYKMKHGNKSTGLKKMILVK